MLATTHRSAPGPSSWSLLGSLGEMQRDPLAFGQGLINTYGDVVRFRFGPMSALALNHPRHFKHVLQDNAKNYRKSYAYRKMEPLLGKGLITAEGSEWLRKRRLVQPAFHKQRVNAC